MRKSTENFRVIRPRLVGGVLTLLVFGYPFVAFSSRIFGGVSNQTLSILMRATLLFLSLRLFWTIGVRNSRLQKNWYFRLFLAFWFLYSVRLVLDVVYVPKQLRLSGYEYLAFGIGSSFIPALALLAPFSRRETDYAFRLLLVVGLIACLGNLAVLWETIASGDVSRIEHDTLNPISLGHLGASVFLLSAYASLKPDLLTRTWHRLALPVTSTIGLICVGLGTSRGPAIALTVGLVGMGFLQSQKRVRKARGFFQVMVLLVVAIGAAFWYVGDFLTPFLKRFAALQQSGGTASVRIQMWKNALEQFANNPILGDAIVTREFLIYPHNVVVEGYMSTGIVGGSLMVALLVLTVQNGFRVLRRYPGRGWIVIIAAQYVVGAMFSGGIWGNSAMWGSMSVVAALVSTASRPAVESSG